MTQLKVRQIGNSLGVVLPKEILTRLNVKSGDPPSRPNNLHAYGRTDICALAAAYASGIVRNPPFIDGNRRTAFLAVLNGLDLSAITSLIAPTGWVLDGRRLLCSTPSDDNPSKPPIGGFFSCVARAQVSKLTLPNSITRGAAAQELLWLASPEFAAAARFRPPRGIGMGVSAHVSPV